MPLPERQKSHAFDLIGQSPLVPNLVPRLPNLLFLCVLASLREISGLQPLPFPSPKFQIPNSLFFFAPWRLCVRFFRMRLCVRFFLYSAFHPILLRVFA